MAVKTERALLSQMEEISDLLDKYPSLSEIMTNADGSVWIESKGEVFRSHHTLSPERSYSIIRLLAGIYELLINRQNPSLSVKLPVFHGGRFQALVPPIVSAPIFSIRFPPRSVMTLDDLLGAGTINSSQLMYLEEAVADKKNILVAGGTGSGKTTIANSLLQLVTDDRLVIIEDNPEIACDANNRVNILTSYHYSLRDAVKDSLRLRPDRIIIGEIRDGGTALDLTKAWLTGHPGGIGTIHSSSAKDVYSRLYSLMQEEVVTPSENLIRAAIDVVIFVQKIKVSRNRLERRVTEILKK